MAIKTTIGPKGVVSEKIAGTTDILVNDTDKTIETVNASSLNATGVVTVVPPIMFMRPGPAGLVTGSLPSVGAGEVGQRILVIKDDTTGKLVLSGATGNKVVHANSTVSAATLELKSNVPNVSFDLVASVSGSSYFWCAVVGSGSYLATF